MCMEGRGLLSKQECHLLVQSALASCGHPAITDTPNIQIALNPLQNILQTFDSNRLLVLWALADADTNSRSL